MQVRFNAFFEEDVAPIFCLRDVDISNGAHKTRYGIDTRYGFKIIENGWQPCEFLYQVTMYMFHFAKTVMDVFNWNEMKHSVKSAERFRRSSAFGGQGFVR